MQSRNRLTRSNGNLDIYSGERNQAMNSRGTSASRYDAPNDTQYLSDCVPYKSKQSMNFSRLNVPDTKYYNQSYSQNRRASARRIGETNRGGSNDLCELASHLKWLSEGESLDTLINEFECELPTLVRVVYDNRWRYGASDTTAGLFPRMDPSTPIVLLSVKRTTFVQCQPVRYSNQRRGTKFQYVGPKIAIPVTYRGWFEVVNEDGHIVHSEDVLKSFIARNISTLIAKEDVHCYLDYGKSLDRPISDEDRFGKESRLSLSPHILQNGSKIQVQRIINVDGLKNKVVVCLTEDGENEVLIDLEGHDRFSPVAKLENIAGMHRIHDIVSKFRFPMTVHLSSGNLPPDLLQFNSFLRLQKMYEQTNVLVIPLRKHQPIYHIPLYTNELLFARAVNGGKEIKSMPSFTKLINICARLSDMYDNCIYAPISSQSNNSSHQDLSTNGIYASPINTPSISSGGSSSQSTQMPMISSACQFEMKPGYKLERHLKRIADEQSRRELETVSNIHDDEDQLHEEIDRLYEQVRYGPNAFVHDYSYNGHGIGIRRPVADFRNVTFNYMAQPQYGANNLTQPIPINTVSYGPNNHRAYNNYMSPYPIMRPNGYFSK